MWVKEGEKKGLVEESFSVRSTVSLKNFCSGKRNGLIKQGFPELSHTDFFYKEQILLFHVMWCVVMYLQFFVLVFPFSSI